MRSSDTDRSHPGDMPWSRRLTAEAVGTFALVFVAAGADTMALVSGGEIGPAARAVAPALVVAAFIYAIGDCSGAHFNPAVSLAFAARRLFPVAWLAPYWLAQIVGGLTAAALLRLLFGSAADEGVSRPLVSPAIALIVEIVLTFLLATVILGTADRYRLIGPDAALAVGGVIAAAGLIAAPIEGASMNPARSLAPALVAGRLDDVAIYIVGPIFGVLLAVIVAASLHRGRERDQKAQEAAQGSP